MKTREITLIVAALVLSVMLTACNKTAPSASGNANSSGKNSNSSSGPSSASNRFVGTWAEEGEKNDKGSKFTEDGKIIELSTNKTVGTYTTSGDDKATINMTEGAATTATLESDTRMKMVVAGETVHLTKK